MTDAVKGPVSYFPSIEKKYGRPIAYWKDLIRSSPLTKHMELVNSGSSPSTDSATAMPTPLSPTLSPRAVASDQAGTPGQAPSLRCSGRPNRGKRSVVSRKAVMLAMRSPENSTTWSAQGS